MQHVRGVGTKIERHSVEVQPHCSFHGVHSYVRIRDTYIMLITLKRCKKMSTDLFPGLKPLMHNLRVTYCLTEIGRRDDAQQDEALDVSLAACRVVVKAAVNSV